MNEINNERYNRISYNGLFFCIEPLPKNLNLLDKFETIQYKGLRMPRIQLNNNNSLNFEQIINDLDIPHLNEKNNKNEDFKDIYIPIKQDEDVGDDMSSKDKSRMNLLKSNQSTNKTSLCKEVSFDKNSDTNIFNQNENLLDNILFKEEKNYSLIPPERFISIFKEAFNNDINLKDTYYNNINNIILNNLQDIKLLINNNIFKSKNYKLPLNNNCTETEYPYLPYYYIEPNIKAFYSSYINRLNNSNKCTKTLFKVKLDSFSANEETKKIKSFLPIKRGRKEKKCNKKIHNAYDDDNILRKIQVHFLSFATNFVNDVIRTFANNKKVPYFRNIDYEIKKTVNHKYVEELKSKCVGELLQLKVSPKMKNHDESVNKEIYQTVITSFPFMYGFLQRSYLSLFKEYFYNKNKIFIVNGKLISLSIKTKTFNDLINKNYAYREKLTSIAINFFLNHYKRFKKPNFIIKNMKKKSKKSD